MNVELEVKTILEPEAIKLIEAYGIQYPNHIIVTEKEQLMDASNLIYPVVMKIVSPDIIHKSDAGCVKVNIKNNQELTKAFDEILDNAKKYNPKVRINGVLVCTMVGPGIETIVGVVKDDIFGPTIMFGLGGIFVELLEDVTFRVCPIDKSEAISMIKEIKAYGILDGMRGQKKLDVDSLADLISKVSTLAVEHQEISEIDLNPVRIYERGVIALDVRLIVQ